MNGNDFHEIKSENQLCSFKVNDIINWIATGLKNEQIKTQAQKRWKLSEFQFERLFTEAKEQLQRDIPRLRDEKLAALLAQARLICRDAIDSEDCQRALDAISLEIELLLRWEPRDDFLF